MEATAARMAGSQVAHGDWASHGARAIVIASAGGDFMDEVTNRMFYTQGVDKSCTRVRETL